MMCQIKPELPLHLPAACLLSYPNPQVTASYLNRRPEIEVELEDLAVWLKSITWLAHSKAKAEEAQ